MVRRKMTACSVGLMLAALAFAGCDSKPATPPPGAPAETAAPTVDLGSPTDAPQDSTGAPTPSPDGAGKP